MMWQSKMTWPMTWHPFSPVGHPVWPPYLATPSGPRQAPRLATLVWPPIGHPVRPCLAYRLATPSGHPRLAPSGPVWPSVWPPRLATPVWPPRLATSSGHLSGPPSGPRLAPVGHPVRPPSGRKKKKKNFFFFLVVVAGWKRGQKIFQFSIPKIPKIPKFPELPELRGLCVRSREKKKVFLA
jgi:hypothetical protein